MQCLLCKELIDDDAAYCDQCGEKIKRCTSCGAPGKGNVCTKCGTRFDQTTSTAPPSQPAQATPPQPVVPGSGTIRCDNQAAVSAAASLLRLVNNNINLSVTMQDGSIVGRASGDNTAIFSAFSQVSGRHCSFACTPAGSWTVTDLGSTNGTFYDNRQLSPDVPQALADQHYLRIANIEFFWYRYVAHESEKAMKLTLHAVSDKGCVRANNEDALLIGSEIIRDCSRSCTICLEEISSPCLFAVADGMGGANAGEVASMMVLEQLRDSMRQLPSALPETLLVDYMTSVCKQIHTMILEAGNGDAAKQGMGTTLTGLLWYEGHLHLLHAGDSRLYRYRNGILAQLSRDHSLRQTSGNNAIASNIIVNSFGGGESFYIDLKTAGGRQLAGDLYLLCSDGLSDMLDDELIEQTLEVPGFEEALLFKAKERGGYDNISYLIIQVVADEDNLAQTTSDSPVKLV